MNDIKLTIIIPVYNQESLIIRALDSIPERKDIEIIVIDDGSTDDTWDRLIRYRDNANNNIVLLYNQNNEGVGYTVNKGYNNANGEYVVLLGSDDYFYSDKLEEVMKYLDGTDLVYFNLQVDNGDVWELNEQTKKDLCGSVKCMRKDFIGNTRCPEIRVAEDYYFYQELLKKNPTEVFTNITAKHYTFPRENSLTALSIKRSDD